MAVPWLQLIDAAIGITSAVRRSRRRASSEEGQSLGVVSSALGGVEARLAGVVVSALKEAFDRDSERLELERTRLEADRLRAERAMRLELLRQAGEREMGRMSLVAGIALVSWLGTLAVASRLLEGPGGRVALGLGWLFLILALASALAEQRRLAGVLGEADDRTPLDVVARPGGTGAVAPWLVVAGLASAALGVLLT